MPTGIVPPPGTIVGITPYFFRVGQSFGPIRSMPHNPRSATVRHFSSRDMRPSAPGQMHCFSLPGRCFIDGEVSWAPAVTATAASAGKSCLRVIRGYRIAAAILDARERSTCETEYAFRMRLLSALLLLSSLGCAQSGLPAGVSFRRGAVNTVTLSDAMTVYSAPTSMAKNGRVLLTHVRRDAIGRLPSDAVVIAP